MLDNRYMENLNIFFDLYKKMKNYPFIKETILEIQHRKLKKLLIYSYQNFSFYKGLMNDSGFNPFEFSSIDDLKKLPIITKKMYISFVDSLVSKNPEYYNQFHIDATSGSTGIPMRIFRTWKERASVKANFLRALKINGYNIFDNTLWVVDPSRITDADSILQKIGILRRDNVSFIEPPEVMVKKYLSFEPTILIAMKSQLVQMALFLKCENIRITKPRICVSYGEILDSNSKKLIQEIFGQKSLIDIYGANELGTLGFQIKHNDFLFPCYDTSIIELDNNGVIDTKRGNAIVTQLDIFSFPLIRYELGDWIEMGTHNKLPIIKKILGRQDDFLTWKDGSKISSRSFLESLKRNEIEQYRIIQDTYDDIRVLLVLKSGYKLKDISKSLINDLNTKVKNGINYKIIQKDVIPPDPNGKIRKIISNVN